MAQVRLGRYEVEEKQLPMVCMRCGAPAVVLRKKNFAWHPQWVFILLLFGLLPMFIVALILTKRMKVAAPFCAEHKNHWNIRMAIGFGGFVALVLFGFARLFVLAQMGRKGDDLMGLFCLGWFLLLLIWFIANLIIMGSTSVRATEITDRSITLNGVCPKFVHALQEQHGPGDSTGRRRRSAPLSRGRRTPLRSAVVTTARHRSHLCCTSLVSRLS